ncbi:MAG: helix-turn-helix domain-containing protein [Cetobacterium sp.]|uniref:helix-turn-helix domain-containing protein n=1 Tax=Cetobacterium sp. TaxID=2071632 RepID=UPI003EE61B53
MRDIREKNWFWLENDLVDREDLKPMERLLYMVLARHSDNESGESFPSEDTLCVKTGVKDKRTIRTYIESLEKKGLISVKRQLGRSNRYFLKSIKVVTNNVVTNNDTTFEKAVTNFAESSDKNCHSNYTHKKTNIMTHEEHEFFENLFKKIGVNFTATNQKSVKKLLKTLSKEQVEQYLLETHENMRTNPNIENLEGAFSMKIMTGERQSKYKEPVMEIPKAKIEPQEKKELGRGHKINLEAIDSTLEAKEIKEEYTAKIDRLQAVYQELSDVEKKSIDTEAYEKALKEYGPAVAKIMARTKTKFEILEKYYSQVKGV